MADEIRADLLLGRDTLSPGLKKAGEAASKAGDNISKLTRDLYELNKQRATPVVDLNDAKATAKLDDVRKKLVDLGHKSESATVDVTDKDAVAKLAALRVRLDAMSKKVVSPRITLEGTDKAEAELLALDVQLDKLTAKSAEADTATTKLAGAGGGGGGITGMGALIGAGTILSPMIVTLGFGLAGLGAAAYGIAKPIENAAQKTGGLQKNMHLLNPEQQTVARGLLSLGKTFGEFQHDLQPTVLDDFSKGLRFAGNLLHSLEPVSNATGKALGGMLSQIGGEFQSGQWQSFFKWMAATAGPDVHLLTQDFVGLLQILPPVLQALQPVATTFTKTVGGAEQTIRVVNDIVQKIAQSHPSGQENIFQKVGDWIDWIENHAPRGHESIGQLIEDALGMNKAIQGSGDAAANAYPHLQTVNQAVAALSLTWPAAAIKAAPLTDTITRMAMAGNAAFHAAGPVTDQITRLGNSSVAAAGHVKPLTDQITMTAQANERAFRSAGPLTDEITNLAIPAKAAAVRFASIATAITAINTAESKSLSNMTAYAGDLVTAANDAYKLEQALKQSHDQIGLNTAAQRASFGAANTYITDLGNTASQANASGKGVNAAISAIRGGLPILDQAKTKNRAYWQEVKTLVGWLHQLQTLKAIHENVYVSGSGTFTVRPGSSLGLPGGTAGGPFAAGGRVPGSGNSDSYAAMLTPGEVVVPKRMVSAGAVDHLRGSLPGFAAGGLVPSYSGSVAGLVPWSRGDLNATVKIFENSIAKATLAGIRSAAASSSPGFGVRASGPLQTYAKRLLQAYGWSSQWPAFNDIVMRESGWNVYAQNPSSGAYGIPQALPGYKMASAGADWRTDGFTQLRWMMGYIRQRWGDPANADYNEVTQHWYDKGGWLKPGLTLAYNGTGRPEMVIPSTGGHQALVLEVHGGADVFDQFMLTWLRRAVRVRGGNVQVVLGRN